MTGNTAAEYTSEFHCNGEQRVLHQASRFIWHIEHLINWVIQPEITDKLGRCRLKYVTTNVIRLLKAPPY